MNIAELRKKHKNGKWSKPSTADEVDKFVLKNLEGYCRKGAYVEKHGFYPTGHFDLDFAVQFGKVPANADLSSLDGFDPKMPGGIPKGKVTEVYGESGGGKSSLCLRAAGQAQKMGDTVMWFDKENSFQENLAKLNGVDLDSMYMSDDPTVDGEKTLELAIEAMYSGIGMVVIDSVASLIPRKQMDNELDKDKMALLARMLSEYVPIMAGIAAETGCALVFINQIRNKPGVMFGDPITTKGGEALKFYSSLRIQVNKRYGAKAEKYVEDENGDEILVAQDSYMYLRKNRFAKTLKEGIPCPIYFEKYFPKAEEVAFNCGRQTQVIKVRNKVFTWVHDDEKITTGEEGRNSFIDHVLEKNLLPELIDDIKEAAKDQSIVLPPEILSFEVVSKDRVREQSVEMDDNTREVQNYLEEDAKEPQEDDEATTTVPRSGKKKAGRSRKQNTLD